LSPGRHHVIVERQAWHVSKLQRNIMGEYRACINEILSHVRAPALRICGRFEPLDPRGAGPLARD
jgi:hypothetical protein